MASAERKIYKEETEKKKKKKKKAAETTDRLSDLAEELQLRILGYLDTKQTVQTMKLSRSWVSLWTRIPILDFSFHNDNNFPKFVNEVLSRRDPLAKLDRVKLNNFNNAEILNSVFEYAFSHGVKHLEASTETPLETDDSWLVCVCDSLTSLQLQSKPKGRQKLKLMCPFLGPRCILFKNLTVLYLQLAYITDVEPFSGFQQLESLTLIECGPYIEWGKILKVHASRLSDLTISDFRWSCLELSTPRLRFFKYHGPQILLKHHEGEGVPVLETLAINFYGLHYNSGFRELEKLLMDELMSFFSTLPPNIKSLILFPPTIILLSLFPNALVRRPSPFQDLKHLKLDFSRYSPCNRYHKPCNGWYDSIKPYFLSNSPDAECTITYPKDIDNKTLLMQLIPKTKRKWH